MDTTESQNLVIIPTFCEEQNVENVIRAVLKSAPDYHILIVDDMSQDETGNIVKRLQSQHYNLHLIERSAPRGLGLAYIDGFRWALQNNYEFIFQMDCDFSHDPADLIALRESANDADLVIGSRYINGIRILNWSIQRLFLSYGASLYTRAITRLPVLDPTSGFKCFRRQALKALEIDKIFSNGYTFQIEINFKLWTHGFRIKEHPIVFTERKMGESKMNRSIVFEALWAIWRLKMSASTQSFMKIFKLRKSRLARN